MTNVAEILETMDYGPAPESAAPVEAWLDLHNRSFDLFINGAWVAPTGGKRIDSINPATGKTLASIAHASPEDVDTAVRAARAAQPVWAKLGGAGRARFIYALARLIQKHSRLFAVLETMDNGKPIRETRDIDVPLAARHFYHHAGWAQLLESEFPDHEAVGVIGQIVPWNFPFLIMAWKVAPALAAGNTIVLKPSKETSLSTLLFAHICEEAKIPAGVVNIITGPGAVGDVIVRHPDINKIAFTGSTEVGRGIIKAAAGTGKKLTMELGGKSPFVVFENADLDGAVEGAVDAIWFNQGQVCCAGSRLFVQESVADRFIAKLKARMETLRVGDPLDKVTDIGAIVSMTQRASVDKLVQQGVAEGAELFQPKAGCPDGCFYPPTLLTNVEPASTVAQEEIFGPVLVAMTFRTPAEAAQLSNNTKYGLAASIWSEDINVALDLAPKIKAGVVWVNCTNQFDAAVGFGGYRESGYGREGGREGLLDYLKPKAKPVPAAPAVESAPEITADEIDRTAKLYYGGKQARPDGGYSRAIKSPSGAFVGHVGEGNRKDIRNAVEAAAKAESWGTTTGHARAQILYYVAENLVQRSAEFATRIRAMTGASKSVAAREVEASVKRLFTYAAWADKYDGAVHNPPLRGVALAMNEPVGVIAIACPDEAPLLAFTSLWAPAVAMGNRVVIVPSEKHPLSATDFYQVLETSDVPGGVVNVVTGESSALALELAKHHAVDAIWYFGGLSKAIDEASADDIKQVWTQGRRDWLANGEGREFLRHATQVKNVWIPYGA
jgi:aldehyde dehydrogenase (NAD+)